MSLSSLSSSRSAATFVVVLIVFIVLIAFPDLSFAAPTGSPLITYPVKPCRVLDTRAGIGPLPTYTAMDVYVRGDNLPASQGGVSDCKVPPEAEAVIVNVAAIMPTSSGHLQISGTGGVSGNYSRINYTAFQNISNEMEVNLCNVYLFPHEHKPCPGPVALPGTYADFQILNKGGAGSSTHLIVDVVGYLSRQQLTSAVGSTIATVFVLTEPERVEVLLTNGLRVVCQEPWTSPDNCGFLQETWGLKAAGHVVNTADIDGQIRIFAHGPIAWDEN